MAPSQLVNQIVLLENLWGNGDVDRLVESLWSLPLRLRLSALCHAMVVRAGHGSGVDRIGHAASRLTTCRRGRVSIEEMAGLVPAAFDSAVVPTSGSCPTRFDQIDEFFAIEQRLMANETLRKTLLSRDDPATRSRFPRQPPTAVLRGH